MDVKIIASGSEGNAYKISDGLSSILLDAGISFKALQKALDFRVTSLAGCLITHSHGDHSKAAKNLIKAGVDIYASEGTLASCQLIGHRAKQIKALAEFKLGSFKILPFDVQHDTLEPLGFLLTSESTGEKLVYFTDTCYIKYRFPGLTHILGECNYSSEIIQKNIQEGILPSNLAIRVIKNHLSLEHLLDFLKANDLSQLQQVYLLHLSSKNSDENYFKSVVQDLTGVEVYIG